MELPYEKVLVATQRHIRDYDNLIASMGDIFARLPVARTSESSPEIIYAILRNPSFDLPSAIVEKVEKRITTVEAKRKGLDYTAKLKAELQLLNAKNEVIQTISVFLGRFPVMINSVLDPGGNVTPIERYALGESEVDPGGYFIYGGRTLVLQAIEHLNQNNPHLKMHKGKKVIRYTSKGMVGASSVNFLFEHNGVLFVTFNYINQKLVIPSDNKRSKNKDDGNRINIFLLFFLMGMSKDETYYFILSLIEDENDRKEIELLLKMSYVAYSKQEELKQSDIDYTETLFNVHYEAADQQTQESMRQYATIIRILDIVSNLFDKPPSFSNNPDLIQRFRSYSNVILENFLANITYHSHLPQETINAAVGAKRRTLAYMICKFFLNKIGKFQATDLDSWGEKYLETASTHIKNKLFDMLSKRVLEVQMALLNNNYDISKIANTINSEDMHKEFSEAFRNNNWKKGHIDSPVVVPLTDTNSDNLFARHYVLNRILVPASKKTVGKQRLVDQSSIGGICPKSTPEGEICGLVKQPAVLTLYSSFRNPSIIEKYLFPYLSDILTEDKKNHIFINGIHYGFGNSLEIKYEMDLLRRSNKLPFDIGIVLRDNYELWFWTTEGRLIIPYLVVNPLTQMLVYEEKNLEGLPLKEVILQGGITYIDIGEQVLNPLITIAPSKEVLDGQRQSLLQKSKIIEGEATWMRVMNALKEYNRYSYMALSKRSILGLGITIIAFLEHSPSARLTYGSGMGKQALTANFKRTDLNMISGKTISSGGSPIVSTKEAESFGFDRYPSGHSMIIAFMSAYGSSVEDASVISKSAIQRGMFLTFMNHIVEHNVKETGSYKEIVKIPTMREADKQKRYNELLDPETGIVRIGMYVYTGDPLIGKVTKKGTEEVNSSILLGINKEGWVLKVDDFIGPKGRTIRVLIRETTLPRKGDKFTSRIAQKGVIGNIMDNYDMPIATTDNEELGKHINGVVPDILFNPHGIPSRMTVSMIIEIIVGLYGLLTAKRMNGSIKFSEDTSDLRQTLTRYGFSDTFKVNMIDGKTGIILESEISLGASFYESLPHHSKPKLASRTEGSLDPRTKSNTRGIRTGGALQFGPMEAHSSVASGTARVGRDALCKRSDEHKFVYCKTCRFLVSPSAGTYCCKMCSENQQELVIIYGSYIIHVIRSLLSSVGYSLKVIPKSTV